MIVRFISIVSAFLMCLSPARSIAQMDDTISVFRWLNAVDSQYITVANNEYTDAQLINMGWSNKTFYFTPTNCQNLVRSQFMAGIIWHPGRTSAYARVNLLMKRCIRTAIPKSICSFTVWRHVSNTQFVCIVVCSISAIPG